MMHIFGHQQRVSVSVYHGISFFQHKSGRSKKKKKKWNQLQNFFQQQGRNPQRLVDKNGGNFNVNLQTKLRPQQGTATQWRGQSQNPPRLSKLETNSCAADDQHLDKIKDHDYKIKFQDVLWEIFPNRLYHYQTLKCLPLICHLWNFFAKCYHPISFRRLTQ